MKFRAVPVSDLEQNYFFVIFFPVFLWYILSIIVFFFFLLNEILNIIIKHRLVDLNQRHLLLALSLFLCPP